MGIQGLGSALLSTSYGAYVVLLQADYAWSKTVFSIGFSLQQVESGILGPFQGWLLDRFGPRAVMRTGIVVFGCGFFLLSRVNSITTFYLALIVMAIGTGLSGFLPLTVTVVNWFVRRRATALGIMATGSGIGGLMAPVVAWSLNTHGWRATALGSGVLLIALGLPLVSLVRQRPEDHGLLPDGDPPATVATPGMPAAALTGFSLREAMHTRAFWMISFGHGSALLVVSAVMVHLVSHLKESLGLSVTQGAAIVALMTASQMVGMVSGGVLGDRFSKRAIVTMCMIVHMAALLTLAFASAVWMAALFAVAHGLAWGIRGPLMQAIRADYFGRASFGKIAGVSSMIVTAGMITGPLVAGIMADRLGDYRAGFTVLAVLAGAGSLFWLLAARPAQPAR